jgi:ornithine cyclodeaminase/alanine dehydrogenase-like protein (mu-crystallin family)
MTVAHAEGPTWLSADDLDRLLPVDEAIAALRDAWVQTSDARAPERIVAPTAGGGQLLLMPATHDAGTGVKLVTVQPANPGRGKPLIHGMYVLFDEDSLAPVAIMDGAAMTRVRTSAVSALALDLLAQPDAGDLVVFGAGVQARAHVAAFSSVRALRSVVVVEPQAERAECLAEDLRAAGLEARTGTADAVADADLVVCCTTATTPVFSGERLRPGTHVTAMGSYQPHTREVDASTVARSRVVVEDREAALAEAGDLLLAIDEGAIEAGHLVADLGEVLRGRPVRRGAQDITLFKSVGIAFEDLVLAKRAFELHASVSPVR